METKRSILYFTIDPETKKRYKSAAALQGKSLKDWVMEAMDQKLATEGREDIAERWKRFEVSAETFVPRIAAGTSGPTDAVRVIRELREERLNSTAGGI